MVVVNDVMVMVVRVLLWWGYGTARLVLLVSLLLLLHEVELMIPLAVQTLPVSLFTLALPFPFTFFAVCPSLLPLPLASGFFSSWDPFISRDDSRS